MCSSFHCMIRLSKVFYLSEWLAVMSRLSDTASAALLAERHVSSMLCVICAAGALAGHLRGVPTKLLAQGEWRGILSVRPAYFDDMVKLLRLRVQCRLHSTSECEYGLAVPHLTGAGEPIQVQFLFSADAAYVL